MKAARNFVYRQRWLPAFGLMCAAGFALFALRSLRVLPGEMFASFTLFVCFLAAMAGASSRTVWAGIAQGSAYALILRWLFGMQFDSPSVTPSQSLCCILPLLTAFSAFVLLHRFTNAFCDRQKPLATNLLFACRNFCLVLACLYAALAATSRTFVDANPSYGAPPIVQSPAFTSPESYLTGEHLEQQETTSRNDTEPKSYYTGRHLEKPQTLSRMDTGTQFVSAPGHMMAGSQMTSHP